MTRQTLARANLILLLILAFLLFMPLLKLGLPPAWVVLVLLLTRLAVRAYSAWLEKEPRHIAYEAVLTVLLGVILIGQIKI